MRTLKEVVEKVLRQSNKSRNSNNWLIIETLIEIGHFKKKGFIIRLDLDDMEEMPQIEAITRCARDLKANDSTLKGSDEAEEMKRHLEDAYRDEERREVEQNYPVASKYIK